MTILAPRDKAGKSESPLYAGFFAFFAAAFGLGCSRGSGGLLKKTRAMSSIDGMVGFLGFGGLRVAMAEV